MKIREALICPKCNGSRFEVKREATYLYTYKLETPIAYNRSHNDEALPFLFDNREKVGSREYLQCESCGAQFPCELNDSTTKVHLTIIEKAIRSDYTSNPDFLG